MIGIRAATHSDLEALAEIGLAAWQRGIQPLVPQSVAARVTAENPFLPFLKAMGSRILVATDGGKPAGLGACEHSDDTISDIWVSPVFEGRGIGSALLAALEQEIAGRGHGQARIAVAAANERAFRLYRHRGYRETWRGTRHDPILATPLERWSLPRTSPAPEAVAGPFTAGKENCDKRRISAFQRVPAQL